MKNQALFSSKDKSKIIKMSSAAIFVWRFKGYYGSGMSGIVFGYGVILCGCIRLCMCVGQHLRSFLAAVILLMSW